MELDGPAGKLHGPVRTSLPGRSPAARAIHLDPPVRSTGPGRRSFRPPPGRSSRRACRGPGTWPPGRPTTGEAVHHLSAPPSPTLARRRPPGRETAHPHCTLRLEGECDAWVAPEAGSSLRIEERREDDLVAVEACQHRFTCGSPCRFIVMTCAQSPPATNSRTLSGTVLMAANPRTNRRQEAIMHERTGAPGGDTPRAVAASERCGPRGGYEHESVQLACRVRRLRPLRLRPDLVRGEACAVVLRARSVCAGVRGPTGKVAPLTRDSSAPDKSSALMP